MLDRHKTILVYDLVRRSNQVNSVLDAVSYYCEGLNTNGDSLVINTGTIENPVVEPMPFKQVIEMVVNNSTYVSARANNLKEFIAEYSDADYYENTNKTVLVWDADLSALKSDGDLLVAEVSTVKNFTKLGEKKALITSDVVPVSDVKYSVAARHTNTINDFLDASYYTLKSINPDNGEVLLLSDVELRNKVRGYLVQVPNFLDIDFGALQSETDDMINVVDYIMGNIDTGNLLNLSDYIGVNVERLPLFRRMWANG